MFRRKCDSRHVMARTAAPLHATVVVVWLEKKISVFLLGHNL